MNTWKLAPLLLLSACATVAPVTVISDRDGTLRGTATAAFPVGTFEVSNEKMTCTGTYDTLSQAPTIEMIFRCSDGRTGLAIVTRTSARTGHGTIRMSDGSTGNLIFGGAAASL